MHKWLCLALAATSLGCSGGTDPVHMIGGNGEYAGPGDPGSIDDGGGGTIVSPTTLSTLVALCIKACAHVHAKDCGSDPAHTADSCESECQFDASQTPIPCADEAADVYTCTIDATIKCSGGFSDVSVIEGCDSKTSDLQKCLTPGTDCVVSPQKEEICLSMGLPTFLICSNGIEPPPKCIPITSSAFCCP